jgi:hypothetical protein
LSYNEIIQIGIGEHTALTLLAMAGEYVTKRTRGDMGA